MNEWKALLEDIQELPSVFLVSTNWRNFLRSCNVSHKLFCNISHKRFFKYLIDVFVEYLIVKRKSNENCALFNKPYK